MTGLIYGLKYFNIRDYLAATDLQGSLPGVIMAVTNRSAGKTVSTHDLLVEQALNGELFVVFYRHKQELSNSSIQFNDILELYPRKYKDIIEIVDKPAAARCIRKYIANIKIADENGEEYIEKRLLGYCVSMFDADEVKKYSAIFSKVKWIYMDEFQIESGRYLRNEMNTFQSLYRSIARGGGHAARDVRVILLSNDVTLINPYFIYYNIPKRLKPNTRKLRGDGWLLIYEFNEQAAKQMAENVVNKTFADTRYHKYSCGLAQLVSTNAFIETPQGKSRYLFTIEYDDKRYGFRYYQSSELMHVSKKIDPSCKTIFVFKDGDVDLNKMIMRRNSQIWKNIAFHYDSNCLRFQDEDCKSMMFDLLGIDLLN